MRKTFVQLNGVLYEKGAEPAPAGPFVYGDIAEYRSMATGELIGGRRQHREHLREHGLIELGNETFRPPPRPKEDRTAVRRTIAAIIDQRYHKAR